MNSLEIGGRILAGVILIGLNAYFVAIEFGLTRARQYPESEFNTPGLQLAWEMTDDLEFYLTTCQIWISGTSIALGIVAEPGLAALFEPLFANTFLASAGAGSVLGFALINLVHLTHGEQTPTYLGVERSKQVCRYGARPLYWFAKLLAPAITFGDWVAKATLGLFGIEMTGAWRETEREVIESRADLRNRLGSILEEGDLPDERREEVMNALRIGEQPVGELMVSPDEIVALSTEVNSEENVRKMEERPHTRYPLVGDTLTDFRGIVYTPSLVRHRAGLADGSIDFTDVAAPPMTVSPDTDVSDAIDQFQTERQELALVIEDGEAVGLITVTDLLEAVMGDIEDPLDQERTA
ncbi:CNNM domain-containing protein [Halopiger djelfimassiliensis]|uniref:CNNM domain-containing protein n=1 Tax=Halopiger djelfimassiliensis TaxID=1293047 RepID=UPI0006778EAF|nr:hemolysin family protein [Halopiger djelfimassiliensis]